MSLKFVTRKLKTQTLGDDDGDSKEVTEKDVRSGESVKSESKNKEDNDVRFIPLIISDYVMMHSNVNHVLISCIHITN